MRQQGGGALLAYLRKHSIRWQLMVTGMIILLLLIVSVVWSYYRVQDMTYERNSVYSQEMIATIRNNIASNADTINRIMPNIAYNEVVQEYLRDDDALARYEHYLKLEKLLVNLKSMKQGILEIVLIGNNGNHYNCINCEEDIPIDEIPERTSAFFLGIYPIPVGVSMSLPPQLSDAHVVLVGVPIYDMEASESVKLGYAVMILDIQAIIPRFEYMSQRIAGTFLVLDRNDRIYASNAEEDIDAKTLDALILRDARNTAETVRIDGRKAAIHSEKLPEIGGTIVSIFPMDELFRGLEDVQLLIVGMFALLIAVLIVCYAVISRNILHPLRSFMSYMYGIRSKGLGNRTSRVAVEGYAEFGVMASQFNALLDEIDGLAAQLISSRTHIFELKMLKQQAELQYLKSQINPHFLYNTLETMKGIATARKVPEIRGMSDALSRIFRYSIKGGEQVSLQDEIEIVEAYINIQRIRFSERFDVEFHFAESTRHCTIVKMILQPLVENAIFHGIEPSMDRCLLKVGSRADSSGHLYLWVQDNGVGMDAKKLEDIRSLLARDTQDESSQVEPGRHIGILNVHRRIRIAYGAHYGITDMQSELGQGTVVTIRIPKRGA